MKIESTELTSEERNEFDRQWSALYGKKIAAWDILARPLTHTVHRAKRMLVWSLGPDGTPRVLRTYTMTDLLITFAGVSITLTDAAGEVVTITHRPTQIPGHLIYAWLPAFLDVRYAPRSYSDSDPSFRRTTCRLRSRAAGDVRIKPVPGVSYFSDVREFQKICPDYQG
jgi:hypothetical protein